MDPQAAALILLFASLIALGFLATYYKRNWRGVAERVESAEREAAEASRARELSEGVLHADRVAGYLLKGGDAEVIAPAALRTIFGLPPSAMAGGPTLEQLLLCISEDQRADLSEAIAALRGSGEAFTQTIDTVDDARALAVAGRPLHAPGTGEAGAAEAHLLFRDVTELVGARRAAEQARDLAAAMVDALPVPIWRRDGEGALVDCNAAYLAAVGESREAVLEQGVELLGKAKGEAARALAGRVRESEAAESEDFHVVVEGSRRLFAVGERPFGEGTIGYALDKSALEEARAELARHVEGHAEVLEKLASGIAIFGSDTRLKFYNTSCARLLGLEESFLQSEPELGDLLEKLRELRRLPEQPDFRAYKQERIRKVTTLIEPEEELQHLPDGTTLRTNSAPHPFGGVLVAYEDVTDRLSLERSYNTLIEVQRETLDNLYEGVAVYGADGRLKLFNPAFTRIWKLASEALAGEPHVRELIRHARALYTIPDAIWEDALEERVAGTTEAEARRGRSRRTDGSVIDWVQVPLPDGAALFTFLDVSDSFRVEQALRDRNEALITADRLKSQFLANISYELRTPLNAIVGFAEILENQYFGALNERQVEYARGIVESSERLTALINDILDLASIEAGYLHLDLAPFDIAELLEQLATLGRERAYSQNVDLKLDYPGDIGRMTGDERRLTQALFNLLSNALQFTPAGGRITLSARRDGDQVAFAVSDTGTGIKPEELDRVFESFQRGERRGPQAGAGLGLSLVKSLIELHGGGVKLESAEGEGTTVTCSLPEHPPESAGEEEEPPAAAESA
jgi:signal transduction histidine kinase